MKIRDRIAAYAAISAFALLAVPAAAAITERVRQDCRGDYQRLCSTYAVGSEGLRACMSRSAKKLSNMCVGALVDGGEMTRAEAAKLRKKAPAKKRTTHKRSTKKH